MYARQINDFETHTYATRETTFLFSSNLLLNSKTIQENNSFFFFLLFFFFFLFQLSFSPFQHFFRSFIFFWTNTTKIKYTPTLAFWYTTKQNRSKGHKKSLSSSCKHNETRVRWCAWTKEMANEWSIQKGIPKVHV